LGLARLVLDLVALSARRFRLACHRNAFVFDPAALAADLNRVMGLSNRLAFDLAKVATQLARLVSRPARLAVDPVRLAPDPADERIQASARGWAHETPETHGFRRTARMRTYLGAFAMCAFSER
jgi:hypothetical protein